VGQEHAGAASHEVTEAVRASARSHAVAAFSALDNANYEDAVARFGEAIRLLDVPTLRVGRADALTHLTKWVAAQADYEAAVSYTLRPEDSKAIAESQKDAATKLAALRARMPRLRVDTHVAIARVAVDDLAPVSLRTGETLALDPGTHQIVIVSTGPSVTHTVQAREHETSVVEGARSEPRPVDSRPTPAADLPTVRDTTSAPSAEFIVAGAATAALALGVAATGVWFLVESSRYEDERGDPNVPQDEKNQDYGHLRTLGWVNVGLCAAAVAAAGVTTHFWISPQFDSPTTRGSSATVSKILPHGFSVGASGHF
jgi:hypothetical protein